MLWRNAPRMRRPLVISTMMLLAWLPAAPAGVVRAEMPGRRPVPAVFWGADSNLVIEWKDDWDATYDANSKRWEKELKDVERSRARQVVRHRYRLITLLKAMMRRWPDLPDKHVEARDAIASCLYAIGYRVRACYVRKQLIDSRPGDFELATGQLYKILGSGNTRPLQGSREGRQWLEYASRRLLAMRRSRHLSETHPAVAAARRAALLCSVGRHDMTEAVALVKSAPDVPAWDYWRQSSRAARAGLSRYSLDFRP